MVKLRPNFWASSSCHCSSIEAGAETTITFDPAPQQHLADDEPGFDGLAEADIVGDDEQIDARQFQRLSERQQLIGVELDAGSERCLEQLAVRRDAAKAAVPYVHARLSSVDLKARSTSQDWLTSYLQKQAAAERRRHDPDLEATREQRGTRQERGALKIALQFLIPVSF